MFREVMGRSFVSSFLTHSIDTQLVKWCVPVAPGMKWDALYKYKYGHKQAPWFIFDLGVI